jgi:hypothetical protein
MRHWLALVLASLLLALGLGTNVRADSPLRVVEDRASVRFASSMTFHIVVEADDTIKSVTLYYRRQNDRLLSRIVPSFTPGKHVEATHDEKLERGEIPPGTTLEYFWRIELANGTHQDTEKRTLVYNDDRFRWQTVSGGNINVLYYGSSQQATLAQDLLKIAQSTLTRLGDEIGLRLEAPVFIYLYQSQQDMSAALAPRSTGFDDRIVTLGVAVSDDTLLLLGDHPDVRTTLPHELSHIVVGLATKNAFAPLPRWLDEGLAMYAEGDLPASNTQALQSAIKRDTLISVRSLSSYTGEASQVDLYYGEVYSVTDFLLRTYGRDKMTVLLEVFRRGTYQDDALQQVYSLNLEGLDAAWRQSLGLKTRPTAAAITPTAGAVELAASATPAATRSAGGTQPLGGVCPLAGILGSLGVLSVVGLRRRMVH